MRLSGMFKRFSNIGRSAGRCSFYIQARRKSTEGLPRYSETPAARWRMRNTLTGMSEKQLQKRSEVPRYQPWSVLVSLSSLMIYFAILREENDIDQMLGGDTLFDIVPGLERNTLEEYVAMGVAYGRDVSGEAKRLQELRQLDRQQLDSPKHQDSS